MDVLKENGIHSTSTNISQIAWPPESSRSHFLDARERMGRGWVDTRRPYGQTDWVSFSGSVTSRPQRLGKTCRYEQQVDWNKKGGTTHLQYIKRLPTSLKEGRDAFSYPNIPFNLNGKHNEKARRVNNAIIVPELLNPRNNTSTARENHCLAVLIQNAWYYKENMAMS